MTLLGFLLFSGCVSKTKARRAAAQAQLGGAYLREGDLGAAVDTLQRATKMDKRNWDAWQKLAMAYSASNAQDRAREAFEQSLKLAPEHAEVNVNYGAWLLKMGENQSAIARLEVAKEDLSYRNTVMVLNNLGYAYYLEGEHTQAITVLNDAIRRAPNQCLPRFHRGLAYEAAGGLDSAAEDFDAVIQLCGDDALGAYYHGAKVLFSMEEAAAACAYLEVIRFEDATKSPLWEEAGILYEERCGP